METEVSTSCRWAGLPVEGGTSAHLWNHPTKIVLSKRCTGIKMDRHWGNDQPMTDLTWDPSHGREPTLDTIDDILLCLQIGALHNFLRGLIQQFMETDAEIHSQTSGEALQVMWKSGRYDWASQSGKRPQRKPYLQSQLMWDHDGSHSLNHQLKCTQWSDIGPLHICSSFATWSSCVSSNIWSICWTACSGLSGRWYTYFCCDLMSQGKVTTKVFPFSEEKWREAFVSLCLEEEEGRRACDLDIKWINKLVKKYSASIKLYNGSLCVFLCVWVYMFVSTQLCVLICSSAGPCMHCT